MQDQNDLLGAQDLVVHGLGKFMEAVNFIAENSLETSSIDLTLYNIHEFPETMDYQILRSEEIVLVLHENHPLAAKAITRPGFRYPWLDLSLLKEENFILLYPDQNTGGIALVAGDRQDIAGFF